MQSQNISKDTPTIVNIWNKFQDKVCN